MTIEIYKQRKTDLMETMAGRRCKSSKYNEAQTTFGRLCELIHIAYCIEKIISKEQYHADFEQASKCYCYNL